ncbi:UNVERIFIED_CONTAM: hypothetical protein Cloal_1269 [Acetivibrio alkalicellulosi]
MKKVFEGEVFEDCPDEWEKRIDNSFWLKPDILEASKYRDTSFRYVVHKKYICCEYTKKINLFTFGKFKLNIPITFIALPFSIDQPGFYGDVNEIIEDYKKRKGFFLLLNLKDVNSINKKYPTGYTLWTCIFENRFESFDHYILSIRSNYRRRIAIAQKKGSCLIVRKINCKDYDDRLHKLYLNVLDNSQYPIERLKKEFFQTVDIDIYVFYKDEIPVAFISTKMVKNTLHFIFGGMDYRLRDQFDLYYNMLLEIVKLGISLKCKKINFGQTGEISKSRIGCIFEKRYMVGFSSNTFLNTIVKCLKPFIEYKKPRVNHKVFKDLRQKGDMEKFYE